MLLENTSHFVNDLMGLALKYGFRPTIVDPYCDYKKRADSKYYRKPFDVIIIDGIYLL
jgi:uridine kinase